MIVSVKCQLLVQNNYGVVKSLQLLDRQHPRDLFDINNMLTTVGFTDEIKRGFIFFLLCSKRPIHEVLNPQLINQEAAFDTQFQGMTDRSFTYIEYETIRKYLIHTIKQSLTKDDKEFLLAFAKGEPNWNHTDYSIYPAVKWKLLNISKLKTNNHEKFREQIELLQQQITHL